MALRTLRYLPGPCTQGARAGAHLTVSPRASVEGARRVLATPKGARRGGPPPAWSSLMGLLRPQLAARPPLRVTRLHRLPSGVFSKVPLCFGLVKATLLVQG
jgi:hypothetical protein